MDKFIKSLFFTVMIFIVAMAVGSFFAKHAPVDVPTEHELEEKLKSKVNSIISRDTVTEKPVYCIKVKRWSSEYFTIVFSNDNFQTEHPLSVWLDGIKMESQYLERNEKVAIQHAKEFKTYNSAINYNAKIKRRDERLRAYQDSVESVKDAKEKARFLATQKEIVIYCDQVKPSK